MTEADLITENETLRERIRHLEDLLAPEEARIPLEWGLVRAEKRVFSALTRREVVTKEALYAALYTDCALAEPPALSAVDSHVSRLRRKLAAFGVTILSRRFEGYTLVNREAFRRRAA